MPKTLVEKSKDALPSPAKPGHGKKARRFKLNLYGLPVSVMHWEGPGPTVFCLHGWLDQGAFFEWVAQDIRQSCNVYALDFRGHGHSAWVKGSSYVFTDYMMDVDTLYRLLGVEKAILLGHSMGGMVASYFAAAYPERVTGIISLEGIGPPSSSLSGVHKYIRDWLDGYYKRLSNEDYRPISFEEGVARLQKSLPKLPEDRARFLAKEGLKKVPGGYAWRFDRRMKERTPYRFYLEMALGIWEGLKGPLVYVQGADSVFMGLNDLDKRLQAMRPEQILTLPGVGHHITLEAPEEVAGIVLDCVKRWESP